MPYQQITILGNLGGDPEMRYTQNGDAVTNFSVAVNEKYGDNEHVEWFRVVTWRQLAETCAQYLSKGREVLVVGRLRTRSYDKDGQTRYSTELMADTVRFVGPPPEGSVNGGGRRQEAAPARGGGRGARRGQQAAADPYNQPF